MKKIKLYDLVVVKDNTYTMYIGLIIALPGHTYTGSYDKSINYLVKSISD